PPARCMMTGARTPCGRGRGHVEAHQDDHSARSPHLPEAAAVRVPLFHVGLPAGGTHGARGIRQLAGGARERGHPAHDAGTGTLPEGGSRRGRADRRARTGLGTVEGPARIRTGATGSAARAAPTTRGLWHGRVGRGSLLVVELEFRLEAV